MADLEGLILSYRDDGSLLSETTFHVGVRHAPYRDYWSNGRLASEGHYVLGLQEGEWRFYDCDGTLRVVLRFKDGREFVDGDEWFRSPNSGRISLLVLVPKLLFGNPRRETPVLSAVRMKQSFRGGRSQTGVWERDIRD
jgi:hypothetical protein